MVTSDFPFGDFSFLNPYLKIYLLILEREKGRERERNINWLPPTYVLTMDWTHSLGMCLDQGSNLQPFVVWEDAPTNLATRKGPFVIYYMFIKSPENSSQVHFNSSLPVCCHSPYSGLGPYTLIFYHTLSSALMPYYFTFLKC